MRTMLRPEGVSLIDYVITETVTSGGRPRKFERMATWLEAQEESQTLWNAERSGWPQGWECVAGDDDGNGTTLHEEWVNRITGDTLTITKFGY